LVARGLDGLPDWPAVATGIDGTFAIADVDPAAAVLAAFQPDSACAYAAAATWPAAGGGGPRELVVPATDVASAWFTGTVRDSTGAHTDLEVFVARVGLRARALVDPVSGAFRAGLLPPGEYRVGVCDPRGIEAEVWTAPVQLGPGATVDCGELRTAAAGYFEVELGDAAGAPVAFALVQGIRDDGAPGVVVIVRDGVGRSEPARAGRYRLSWSEAPAGAVVGAEVQVVPGGTVPRVVLRARPARDVELSFPGAGSVEAVLHDSAGCALGRWVATSAAPGAPAALRLALPPGTYRVVACDERGARGECELAVPNAVGGAADAPGTSQRVDLR
jgi:hypothetical protein